MAKNSNIFDPENYSISVKKVHVDGDTFYQGCVRELPDVEIFERSAAETYEAVTEVISTLYEVHVEQGRPFPAPIEEEMTYSGRVTLRLRKSLHRRADLIAQSEGVSLNSYLSSVIEAAVTSEASSSFEVSFFNEVEKIRAYVESGITIGSVISGTTATTMSLPSGIEVESDQKSELFSINHPGVFEWARARHAR